MLARIYRPTKTAMQSGRRGTDRWVLEFAPRDRPAADPLMGTNASTDMMRQVRLTFETREAAEAYAARSGIAYRVAAGDERVVKPQSYADNFRSTRYQPWTH